MRFGLSRRGELRGLTLAILVTAVIQSALAVDEAYVLGPGDRILVSVFNRPDLSGPHIVSPSGAISLPLVGQLQLAGLDLVRAQETVAAAYTDSLRSDSPVTPEISVSLEILQYRPFYVLGDVDRAGAYPYQGGLTVLQAIAVAGGRLSTRNATKYSPTDISREEEILSTLLDSYLTDVVDEARLVSEQQSLSAVQLPNDVAARLSEPRVQEVVSGERQLFRTRAGIIEGQLKLLSARIDEYSSEISELRDERGALRRKRDLIGQRVSAFRNMVEKGAGARMDLLQLEINSIEAEREIRQNSVLILDATLGRNEAQQNVTNLHTQRAHSIASDLVAVRTRLSQTLIRIHKSTERLALMGGASEGTGVDGNQTRYVVRRQQGDSRVEILAGPDTPVRPSDTVIVPFPTKPSGTDRSLRVPERLPDSGPE